MNGLPTLLHVDTEGARTARDVVPAPTVGILMSTYNGEKYLADQIDSIAAQDGVNVELFIRDDGSTDGTRQAIESMAQQPLGCIGSWHLDFGKNIGFLQSFEHLLFSARGCDYYSFSDQDDFWLPEKTIKAIECIDDGGDSPALYASSVEIVDENLEHLGRNDFPNFRYSIGSELVRHRLAGHTMLWNDALQRTIRVFGPLSCWSHDQHLVIANYLAGADLHLDSASYVLHRRLADSLTPGGGSISKRLRHEMSGILNSKGLIQRKHLASDILALSTARLSEADRRFLEECASDDRLSLLFDPAFDCGLALGNAGAKLSVLLGRF